MHFIDRCILSILAYSNVIHKAFLVQEKSDKLIYKMLIPNVISIYEQPNNSDL